MLRFHVFLLFFVFFAISLPVMSVRAEFLVAPDAASVAAGDSLSPPVKTVSDTGATELTLVETVSEPVVTVTPEAVPESAPESVPAELSEAQSVSRAASATNPIATKPEQMPDAIARPRVDAAALRDILRVLKSEADRARLIEQLTAIEAAQAAQQQVQSKPKQWQIILTMVGNRVQATFQKAVNSFGTRDRVAAWLKEQWETPLYRKNWGIRFRILGMILGAAILAHLFLTLCMRWPRRKLAGMHPSHWSGRVFYGFLFMGLSLVPTIGFVGTAFALLPQLEGSERARNAAFAVVMAHIWAQGIKALIRLPLEPRAAGLRWAKMEGETAAYLDVWMRRLLGVSIYGFMLANVGVALAFPPDAVETLQRLVGLLLVGLLTVFILQNRQPVANVLHGRGKNSDEKGRARKLWQGIRRTVAAVWHWLALAYIVTIYAVWAFEIKGGLRFTVRGTIATLVILVLARVVLRISQKIVAHGFRVPEDLNHDYPLLEQRLNRYLPLLGGIVRMLVWSVVGLAILNVWHLGGFVWLRGEVGQNLLARGLRLGILLVASVMAWELTSGVIERWLHRIEQRESPQHGARLRTLLPMLRTALLTTIVIVATLIGLAQLGFNIAPLLAGAGVLGIAIGFGSQSLVKDFITGLFVLLEDSVAVGDVVEVGGHSGVVERLSLRAIRLRDLHGAVHDVPFGEVTTVVNKTKDYSFFVSRVSVAYGTDMAVAIAEIIAAGEEVRENPDFIGQILESLEILGVDELGDSGVIIKIRIKTLPGRQWGVGRAFNSVILRRFAAKGIEIPFPQRKIIVEQGKAVLPEAALLVD